MNICKNSAQDASSESVVNLMQIWENVSYMAKSSNFVKKVDVFLEIQWTRWAVREEEQEKTLATDKSRWRQMWRYRFTKAANINIMHVKRCTLNSILILMFIARPSTISTPPDTILTINIDHPYHINHDCFHQIRNPISFTFATASNIQDTLFRRLSWIFIMVILAIGIPLMPTDNVWPGQAFISGHMLYLFHNDALINIIMAVCRFCIFQNVRKARQTAFCHSATFPP